MNHLFSPGQIRWQWPTDGLLHGFRRHLCGRFSDRRLRCYLRVTDAGFEFEQGQLLIAQLLGLRPIFFGQDQANILLEQLNLALQANDFFRVFFRAYSGLFRLRFLSNIFI